MIPLDSPKWSELQHAYGSAANLPDLLRAVYANPYAHARDSAIDRVWFDLWGCLCHQGSIYPASIAAVPHLVEAGLSARPGVLAWEIVLLPVEIEKSRLREHPAQLRSEEEDAAYLNAILRLEEVCERTAEWGRDADLGRAVKAARQLLSKRRGSILPKQKTNPGPLFQ